MENPCKDILQIYSKEWDRCTHMHLREGWGRGEEQEEGEKENGCGCHRLCHRHGSKASAAAGLAVAGRSEAEDKLSMCRLSCRSSAAAIRSSRSWDQCGFLRTCLPRLPLLLHPSSVFSIQTLPRQCYSPRHVPCLELDLRPRLSALVSPHSWASCIDCHICSQMTPFHPIASG